MFSLNTQEPEKEEFRPDGTVEIVDVFYTIQGEGPFAGRPAVFVRTAGCNLTCNDCDTDYTSNRRFITSYRLAGDVWDLFRHHKLPSRRRLAVITGGEPFRQNLTPLLNMLMHECEVQVETNGTLFPSITHPNRWPKIVLSPKTPKVHSLWEHHDVTYKYIIEANKVDPEDGLPTSVLGNGLRPARPKTQWNWDHVYVQPADVQNEEANKANLDEAVKSCMKFGYTLSLQSHKIIGLP